MPTSGNVITSWPGFAKGFSCKLEGWKKEVDGAKKAGDKDKKTSSNAVVVKTAT